MGTPAPDNEPASGCALCFGANGFLGSVQPKYLTVTITGTRPAFLIDDAHGVNADGIYRLQHKEACLYEFNDISQLVRLDWTNIRSRVFHIVLGVVPTNFFSEVGVLCSTTIQGNTNEFLSKAWIAGIAKITWSLEGL